MSLFVGVHSRMCVCVCVRVRVHVYACMRESMMCLQMHKPNPNCQ